ncbi:hypothetical protein AMECASPLE_033451 [Ameca splendens]|uniref:Ubiquitin-like domain-containing protein n=1 Tax=Ameca splendens TaxID=208324 RepID=A0ABV0YHX1_9TELE
MLSHARLAHFMLFSCRTTSSFVCLFNEILLMVLQSLVYLWFSLALFQVIIRLDQTVAELKKQLTTVVQLSTNSMRLYYIDKNSPFGPEELKYNTLALHSYSIQDGDEILVVRKTK